MLFKSSLLLCLHCWTTAVMSQLLSSPSFTSHIVQECSFYSFSLFLLSLHLRSFSGFKCKLLWLGRASSEDPRVATIVFLSLRFYIRFLRFPPLPLIILLSSAHLPTCPPTSTHMLILLLFVLKGLAFWTSPSQQSFLVHTASLLSFSVQV